MQRLKEIIEKSDTREGRYFDLSIQGLIIVSIVSFSLDTLPEMSDAMNRALRIVEVFTVILFTIEYLLRLLVSDRKLKHIFSFYGLVDLFAILPFYITTGIDLRSLRALRLMRLFQIFKMIRYSKAIKRFSKALAIVKEEIIMFTALTIILLFLAGTGIYFFENPAQPEAFASIFDGIWWALESLTTVGYGDIHPITAGGKIFTFFILMLGLGIVAIPAGLIASALSKAREMEN